MNTTGSKWNKKGKIKENSVKKVKEKHETT